MAQRASMVASMTLEQAIEQGQTSGRLWLYSNYHCNLTCQYCLTSSGPTVPKNALTGQQMLDAVRQATQLGFQSIGLTGGEPFLHPEVWTVLPKMADLLPVIVLSNGTMFHSSKNKSKLSNLCHPNLQIQISIDSNTPLIHDRFRGEGTFRRAMEAIPLLRQHDIAVRVSSTRSFDRKEDAEKHSDAMMRWGISLGLEPKDIVLRTMVQRGQAINNDLGIEACGTQFPADLTLTRMGAYFSPFGPTVLNGTFQTDLLLTRTILPLEKPLRVFLGLLGGSSEHQAANQSAGFV